MCFRCNIPGCDQEPYNFNQQWISNGIPEKNGFPEKCIKYEQLLIPDNATECYNSDIFNSSHQVKCNNFIYDTNELTLQNEVRSTVRYKSVYSYNVSVCLFLFFGAQFNLTCENEWKLTLIGTINNAGLFFFMAVMGILSDKLSSFF